MKKSSLPPTEKLLDSKNLKSGGHVIKFNLSSGNLACFKGQERTKPQKTRLENQKQLKGLSQLRSETKGLATARGAIGQFSKLYNRTISGSTSFNEQVVFMQYDDIDVYIDNSTRKNSKQASKKSSKGKDKKQVEEESGEDEFLESCVRVITEETDNTSNPLSLNVHELRSEEIAEYYEMINYYQPRGKPMRNRRSITFEESKVFYIDFDSIEADGRTTIMVKNIPNKYTQQMLLEEFSINHENKFDFFYLPIDKDNQCNVGYAFLNFINTADLKSFYQQFHMKKWKKYRSPKICNICYARYQGTLELANHFRHTKILYQKDKKLRPLIGLTEANKIKDIEEIIKNQQGIRNE